MRKYGRDRQEKYREENPYSVNPTTGEALMGQPTSRTSGRSKKRLIERYAVERDNEIYFERLAILWDERVEKVKDWFLFGYNEWIDEQDADDIEERISEEFMERYLFDFWNKFYDELRIQGEPQVAYLSVYVDELKAA